MRPQAVPEPAPGGSSRLDRVLFALSLALLLGSRLVRLADYPIYFFCDEAIHALRASEFLRDGCRDEFRQLFPTYFHNGPLFNISTSVYAQVLPVLLFGRSVVVTRGVSVLVAFSGAVAVALILRRVFRARFWWVGALVLSVTPAWFLHSRTAFETAMATAFYAWFLYFYLRYREGRPRALYASVVFAALAFYTYSPMKIVVPASGVLFFLSDLRFHWRNRLPALKGLALVLVLALPYARFHRAHPESSRSHLEQLFSYWTSPGLTAREKLSRYGREYVSGLSPAYWYRRDNAKDLDRHRMKGYGHLPAATLPFAALGLLVCLRNVGKTAYRTVLLSALAAPAGAAVVAMGITRALVFVVPAALLAALGVAAFASFVARRLPPAAVAVSVFAVFAVAQVAMARDALENGPTWFHNYGLGGMQYGARQVFGEIRRELEKNPRLRFAVSPIWANGADDVKRFFLGDDKRVELKSLDWYTAEKRDLGGDRIAVLTPEEHRRAASDPRFAIGPPVKVLEYPDGAAGFYFVRLAYAPDIEARMAAERMARHALVQESVFVAGEILEIAHSRFDMGSVGDLFDGDVETLARTGRVNPAVIEIRFPSPRRVAGVTVTTGSMDRLRVTLTLFSRGAGPQVVRRAFEKLPPDPTVRIPLSPPAQAVEKLRIEVEEPVFGNQEIIHVREIRLE